MCIQYPEITMADNGNHLVCQQLNSLVVFDKRQFYNFNKRMSAKMLCLCSLSSCFKQHALNEL